MEKKVIRSVITLFFLFILIVSYLIFFKKNQLEETKLNVELETTYNSNIIDGVEYVSKDSKGNEYIINAVKGEIDFLQTNIIFLKNVTALIKLNNSNNITITSNFGKYNIDNFDTIFSENVIIEYLDGKITGGYLDFSIKRNSMIISKDIVYTNLENVLKADVMEMNIETKDSKIFMYEDDKKVNIKSIN